MVKEVDQRDEPWTEILRKKMNRRQALSTGAKVGIGVGVAAAVGGGIAAYFYAQPAPSPTQTPTPSPSPTPSPTGTPTVIRHIDYGPALYEHPDYVAALKKDLNIELEVTAGSAATLGTQVVAAKGKDWDTLIGWGSWSQAVYDADVIKPIAVDKIPRWKEENLSPLYKDPKKVLGDVLGEAVIKDTWMPGKEGQEFAGLPVMWGADTFGILAEFVDHPLTSWGDMLDRQWKGRVALADIPTIVLLQWAMYLVGSKQMPEPELIYDLKPNEVDLVVDFLTPHHKAGQFRAFWADFGTGLNLLTSREVYVADIWNSHVYGARQAGVPSYYIMPKEGCDGWYGTEHVLVGAKDELLPSIYAYMNHRLGASFAIPMAKNAYQTATYPAQEVKDAAGPEFYDWNYNGKATYKPIEEIVPDKDPWIANGLFDPFKYEWSTQSDTPHPSGNLKDRGSIDNLISNTHTILTWENHIGAFFSAWTKFKQSA